MSPLTLSIQSFKTVQVAAVLSSFFPLFELHSKSIVFLGEVLIGEEFITASENQQFMYFIVLEFNQDYFLYLFQLHFLFLIQFSSFVNRDVLYENSVNYC